MPKKERTPRKTELIKELIKEYGVNNLGDIQEALRDLLGVTIEEMLKEEIKDHLGY